MLTILYHISLLCLWLWNVLTRLCAIVQIRRILIFVVDKTPKIRSTIYVCVSNQYSWIRRNFPNDSSTTSVPCSRSTTAASYSRSTTLLAITQSVRPPRRSGWTFIACCIISPITKLIAASGAIVRISFAISWYMIIIPRQPQYSASCPSDWFWYIPIPHWRTWFAIRRFVIVST